MHERLVDILPGLALFVPLAAVVLTIVARRGLLRESALAAGSQRRIGLEPLDLAIAMILPLATLASVASLAFSPAGALESDAPPARVDGAALLRTLLLNQAWFHVPFAGWFLLRARLGGGWRAAGVIPTRPGRDAAAAALGLLVAVPLVLATNALMVGLGLLLGEPAPRIAHQVLEVIRDETSPTVLAGLLTSALVLAPLLEEFIFRGLLQTALLEVLGWRRRWPIVLLSAALFSLVHATGVPWQVLPGLFVLGVVLGWLVERTGSLWPSIGVHAAFNGLNAALVLSGLLT